MAPGLPYAFSLHAHGKDNQRLLVAAAAAGHKQGSWEDASMRSCSVCVLSNDHDTRDAGLFSVCELFFREHWWGDVCQSCGISG